MAACWAGVVGGVGRPSRTWPVVEVSETEPRPVTRGSTLAPISVELPVSRTGYRHGPGRNKLRAKAPSCPST